ncbi:MAG: M48 family metallopeptidase [Pikeienuella sp.]
MTHDDMPIAHWSLAGLRNLGAGSEALSLTPDFESDERLTLDDPDMVAAIRQVCPSLDAPAPTSRSGWRRAGLWTVAALGSFYLILFHIAPALSDQLAELIPPETEVAMGEEMVEQFTTLLSDGEPRFCTGGAGERALAKLTARISANANAHVPLTVRVLDHEMVNAFALPGGQIVIFRGLLRNAEGPEALAGVLGHEIGHVVARDPTRLTLRAAGTAGLIGLLLGDFTGATITVALSEALMQSGYQREAESQADDFAAKLLGDQGLPTTPFAGFFIQLKAEGGDVPALLTHLSSHPDLSGRAAAMRAADRIGDQPFEPALSDQDWVALRNICR